MKLSSAYLAVVAVEALGAEDGPNFSCGRYRYFWDGFMKISFLTVSNDFSFPKQLVMKRSSIATLVAI